MDFLAIARPMLMRLSDITPSPTQRFIPFSPLYRQRLRPCRRLATLMRPSHPVRHFWPFGALLLLTFALGTLGGTIGNADAPDALRFGCCFIFGGVKSSVGCHQVR